VQVRERRILQENQKQVCASKLPPNPEERINTIFNQFSNRLARSMNNKNALKASEGSKTLLNFGTFLYNED